MRCGEKFTFGWLLEANLVQPLLGTGSEESCSSAEQSEASPHAETAHF